MSYETHPDIQRRTLTVTVRGEAVTFRTEMTDAVAIYNLGQMTRQGGHLQGSNFARDLHAKYQQNLGLSDKQMAWVHKLVIDAEERNRQQAEASEYDMNAVVQAMKQAQRNGLKRPTLRLHHDDFGPVMLKVAGRNSRRPGDIQVTNGKSYGDRTNAFYGWINVEEGQFEPHAFHTRNMDVARLCEWLEQVCRTVEGRIEAARAYARETGQCCFCGKQLTDPRSLAVSYGPICAGKWGLPWGEADASEAEQLSATREH